jgi:hypothetical protein
MAKDILIDRESPYTKRKTSIILRILPTKNTGWTIQADLN